MPELVIVDLYIYISQVVRVLLLTLTGAYELTHQELGTTVE